MRRRRFLQTALGTAVVGHTQVSSGSSAVPPDVAKGLIPIESVTVVYNGRSTAEAAAAQELGKFLGQMAGKPPRLVDESREAAPAKHDGLFQVGRTAAVQGMLAAGTLADPAGKHPEGYQVRSVSWQGNRSVVFLGGSGIATLYAVYHYLECLCGCGFFSDGDHVPQHRLVPAEGIQIATQPRFNERMLMNLTLYWYSVSWWEWEDWQQYIDWGIKNRYNILSLWDTPGEDEAWFRAWKKLGITIAESSYSGPPFGIFAPIKYQVQPPLPAAWREGQGELNRKIIEYARARGMRTLVPAIPGIVPPEFSSHYPDAHTFQISWAQLPKQNYLHPSDPMYARAGEAFLEEYLGLYGTDHLYWLDNYLECDVHGPDELQREVRREIAGANFKVIDRMDPKGIGILSSWTFLFQPSIWTAPLIREHLDRVPADRIRVLDQWAEQFPVYKQMDYLFGRPWYFGVVHSFGGNTNLHGDMSLIERQFKEVASDPRADRCVGFSPTEETILHNYFYYQFLAKLGWNPGEVDLKSFTRQYATTRYGDAGSPSMQGALEELRQSIYSSDDLALPLRAQPLYWHRPRPEENFHVAQRAAYIPHLRRALERALEAKQALATNPLYLHDLNDMARQYLSELFNAHLLKLNEAHSALDGAAFDKEAAKVIQVLEEIEKLLSLDDYYWLSSRIKKGQRLPGALPDTDRRARDIFTLWAGVIRDYACRDFYELVQGYYKPRVTLYIQELRERMRLGQRLLYNSQDLDAKYDALEKRWVKDGFPLLDTPAKPGQVIERVEEILRTHAPGPKT